MYTPETKAAFITAQTAMMYAEMELMKAENREREFHGHSYAHGPEEWAAFIKQWEHILGYNAVVEYLRS